jgi:hypothetical protein
MVEPGGFCVRMAWSAVEVEVVEGPDGEVEPDGGESGYVSDDGEDADAEKMVEVLLSEAGELVAGDCEGRCPEAEYAVDGERREVEARKFALVVAVDALVVYAYGGFASDGVKEGLYRR